MKQFPMHNNISRTQISRVVFPSHVIRLRCDIAVNRTKALLDNLTSEQSTTATMGKLKSGRSVYYKVTCCHDCISFRLLPMGVVVNGSDEKCLGIVTGEDISDVF